MGCTATVFEPVPAYQNLLRFGLSLNPGFQRRAKLYSNVVYPQAGIYNVSMPQGADVVPPWWGTVVTRHALELVENRLSCTLFLEIKPCGKWG